MSEIDPPIELLLPHWGPALLLERMVSWSADSLECVGRIPRDNAFVDDGTAPSFVALELGAQGAAALEALLRRRSGDSAGPRVGYLVSIREARFGVERIPAGAELRTTVRLLGGAAALATYAVSVEHAGVQCASATVSTYAGARR